MSVYSVQCKKGDNVFDIPFSSLSFSDELNVGQTAQFSVDYYALKRVADNYNTDPIAIVGSGKTDVLIYRENVLVYRGQISNLGASSSDTTISLTIASVGYFNLLQKRNTGEYRFYNTNSADIAWDLIEQTQVEDSLGITRGTSPIAKTRQRTLRVEKVNEVIKGMSNDKVADGFDFEITPQKVFNVFYPRKGGFRPNIIMNRENIKSWSLDRDLSINMSNTVHVVGEGVNDDAAYIKVQSAVQYINEYGLLEDFIREDSADLTFLEDKGKQYISEKQSPFQTISLSHIDGRPNITEYSVGDTITITIEEIQFTNRRKRVVKRNVSVDENSLATVSLTVE